MDCQSTRKVIGAYLDDELSPEVKGGLEAHLASCADCRAELDRMRDVFSGLPVGSGVKAPESLWPAIEHRLERRERRREIIRLPEALRRPLAAAASVLIVVGLGIAASVWLNVGASTAQAATIDYTVLLDGLADDVDRAVESFLTYYKAEPISRVAAGAAAPSLRFTLPETLPGDYRLDQVYRMQFGDQSGIAARYAKGGEPIIVFFHPPMDKTLLGVHRESSCQVAGRDGHRVEVGPWRLIHFTDPTTCHCVLSTFDSDDPRLAAVLKAIAPGFTDALDATH